MSKFQKVIRDLNKTGLTQAQIAKAVGCSQKQISYLFCDDDQRRVREPRWTLGDKLLRLRAKRVRK